MSGDQIKKLTERLDAESAGAASVGAFEACGILHEASLAIAMLWNKVSEHEAAKQKLIEDLAGLPQLSVEAPPTEAPAAPAP